VVQSNPEVKIMTLHTHDQSSTVILERIDAIITELQILRRQLSKEQFTGPSSVDLVERLAGSLGQGTWDEYDLFLEWERFDT
jgi:hypothetical protein